MAPLEGTPIEVQQAPAVVRQAYQFAAANSEIMTQIPCYCGCGAVGHTSNYACYVSGTDASGLVQYDLHALGCSLCVDITLDVMRMLRQGKVTAEMRAFIDATYAQYGPSNMP
ncbi:MAG TPA: PCYCGC motif-containing (lipo)protein [Anaerolineales bacterium]|nr:PCYCGC motif-containing (lipo)protein [Anaerolineales bacterium]